MNPFLSEIQLGSAIRAIREQKGKKAIQIAKASGIDPRTLAAIETGRIKNPSLNSIQAIAKALEVSPADIFFHCDLEKRENIYQGDQKGEFTVDFSAEKFKVVSLIPFTPDFFIGKILMSGDARIRANMFSVRGYFFVQVILGKLDVTVAQKKLVLKEGEHLLLNGKMPHQFVNPLHRETSFFLVTVPSFMNSVPINFKVGIVDNHSRSFH